MYQQGKDALNDLKKIFKDLDGMMVRSIEFMKRERDAPDYEKIQVDGNWLRVYRSIRIEWEGLNFDGWIADVRKKVERAIGK